jgi:hypothetical protein
MDFLGPTRNSSLGGRKYILVIVDDYSQYTWEDAQHLFKFEEYCHSYGIQHEFSSPIIHQQNGVVERKNRVLQEMARVMIHSKNLAQYFWGEAINTACHIINRVYLRPETSNTPYDIW